MNPFGLLVVAIGVLLVWIALGLGSSSSSSPKIGNAVPPVQPPGSTGGIPNTRPGSQGSKKLA